MTTATINILDGSLTISRTTNLAIKAERGYSAQRKFAIFGLPFDTLWLHRATVLVRFTKLAR